MAFSVGDEVLFNGMPGQVMMRNEKYNPPLNLVLIEQPVVRWIPDGQLQPALPPAPAQASTAPASTGS